MNMNKLNIFSIEFGNGKMFFVGKNESIKYIKIILIGKILIMMWLI